MDRMIFRNSKLSFLTKKEILNPFVVLKKAFKKEATCEAVQDELWELVSTAFRKNYWMTFRSPKVVYLKFLKIVRLCEAAILISKIRPNYSLKNSHLRNTGLYQPAERRKESFPTIVSPADAYHAVAFHLCSMRSGGAKFDFFNFLYHGLASLSFQYTDLLEECAYDTYRRTSELISALFTIYHAERGSELTKSDKQKLKKLVKDALDSNRPRFHYQNDFANVYEEYSASDLFNALDYLNSTSFDTMFWQRNDNPGTVLFYFDELLFLLEAFWSYSMRLKPKWKEIAWNLPGEVIINIKYLPKEALKHPISFLDKKFVDKPLSAWQTELEAWKLEILEGNHYRSHRYKELTSFLFCLAELASLLEYDPKRLAELSKYATE